MVPARKKGKEGGISACQQGPGEMRGGRWQGNTDRAPSKALWQSHLARAEHAYSAVHAAQLARVGKCGAMGPSAGDQALGSHLLWRTSDSSAQLQGYISPLYYRAGGSQATRTP